MKLAHNRLTCFTRLPCAQRGVSWLTLGCGLAGLGLLMGCSRAPEFRESGPRVACHASRVVSLAPSLTEIICAIGAETQLVGRTSACDYPPDKIKAIPVVGGFGAPSLDLLLQIEPTLVLTMDLEDKSLGNVIDQLGLKRERIRCSTVDDIPRAISRVGSLLRRESAAGELADSIRRRLAEFRREAENRQASGRPTPAVFVEIWGSPLTTVGKRSFISDLIFLAGGHNLGDEAADKEYFSISSEWVIARNPDAIVCLYMSREKDNAGRKSENGENPDWARVNARTGWSNTAAVQNHRVYGGLDNSAILRPGPRILDGIEALRRCIETSP